MHQVRKESMHPLRTTRGLQATVALLSLVPVATGAAGVLLGPGFLMSDATPWVDLDSHFRYLSGIFLAVGLGFLSCIPNIVDKVARFRALSGMVVLGGLARLLSLAVAGSPATGHRIGLILELVVVPALVLWQARLARPGNPPVEAR